MDHPNHVDNLHAATPLDKSKDPVCGMDVNTATARFKTQHNGKEYFFCSAGCLAKFQANSETILSSAPKPMGSGLVSLGGPALVMPTMVKPAAPNAQSAGGLAKDTRADVSPTHVYPTHVSPTYVCPMCPEVRQLGPGPCPKCGMALDPESPALPATRREYTCPMHPEIVRAEPGSCPICGMALEPRTVTV
jgi:P-type Cu+ transporter